MYIRMVYGRVATHVVENCYVGEVHRMVFMSSYGMTLVLLDIFGWFIFSGVHLKNIHCTNLMLSQFHVFHCTIFLLFYLYIIYGVFLVCFFRNWVSCALGYVELLRSMNVGVNG